MIHTGPSEGETKRVEPSEPVKWRRPIGEGRDQMRQPWEPYTQKRY